ncbi:hypothetical protein [Yokenella regensburgei]|uniref:hypothetical protein n=1 Tax=Yokenella regensburgei TaxID=158877 RepID=UPI0013759E5F|nr:hypothetical protein [Yokenella regensburgei]KAF1367363.1 hypothetical protein FHR25_004043 [Yokenella regensburgei]QIU89347.1 hypothetical protein HEC60_08465 [Yokenella regensburgei]
MEKPTLTPEQQIRWAKGKLVTSVFLNDADGCNKAWEVLRNNRKHRINRKPDQVWRNSI